MKTLQTLAVAASIAILAGTAARAESITTRYSMLAAIGSDRRRKPATRRSSTMRAATRPDHPRTLAAERISMMRAAIRPDRSATVIESSGAMKNFILVAAMIVAAFPARALEVGDHVIFPGPEGPIGCSHFEDTRQSVFHAARYGRQYNKQSSMRRRGSEGPPLRHLAHAAIASRAGSHRVVEENKTGGGTYFAYFCLIVPNSDSCLWIFLPEQSISSGRKN